MSLKLQSKIAGIILGNRILNLTASFVVGLLKIVWFKEKFAGGFLDHVMFWNDGGQQKMHFSEVDDDHEGRCVRYESESSKMRIYGVRIWAKNELKGTLHGDQKVVGLSRIANFLVWSESLNFLFQMITFWTVQVDWFPNWGTLIRATLYYLGEVKKIVNKLEGFAPW